VTRLRGRAADDRAGEDLRAALTAAGAAGAIVAPAAYTDLLDEIVATAAHVLRANAASLYLIDETTEELVFEVSLGEKAAEVRKFRLPLGRGFAGFTAATGQAIAVADVQRDPRWAQEIGRAVQYTPQTILCVPLIVGDRVIGVLQLLDKLGGMPFDQADIETAGRFATQAAIAISQSRATQSLRLLLRSALTGTPDEAIAEALASAGRLEGIESYRETARFAAMLGEISRRGDAERRLVEGIVSTIHTFLRSTPRR
jgi:GAF domain-containing protein